DEDRPRRRDEDFTDHPRRDRREDDYDDRPRHLRRDEDDDYDYEPRRRPKQLTGLDATFANTNIVLLVLFGLFCGGIAFLLGVIWLITCKDEKARRNALIATIIGGVIMAVGISVNVLKSMP